MSRPRRLLLLALPAALVLLGGLLLAPAAKADVPPDILDSYTIDITPQADGMLSMQYTLTGYHAMSDWPSDQPYLQIGVPNSTFSITSFEWKSVDVSRVEPVGGYGSFVQFDFGTLPKNGDVFDLRFTITQGRMAYPNAAESTVTFKFIPAGWTFPIRVNQLEVSWPNPSDPSLLKVVRPDPTNGEKAMTWQWANPAMDSFGMFAGCSVELAYDQSAFVLSDRAIGQGQSGAVVPAAGSDTGSGSGTGSGSDTGGLIPILVAAGLTLAGVVGAASGDGYGSGSGIHSGGGSFSGGSSCACAGCACACACAGGGKVGCSRKAIGVACLPGVIRSMTDAAG